MNSPQAISQVSKYCNQTHYLNSDSIVHPDEELRNDPDCNDDEFSDSDPYSYQYRSSGLSKALADEGLEIEQGLLNKLTKQRQRIEELSYLYQENQNNVARLTKENEGLKAQNQRLGHLASYYPKFEELRRQYQVVHQKLTLSEDEISDLKCELQRAINQNSTIVNKLKTQYKKSKSEQNEKLSVLEDEMNEKEDEMQRLIREWKNKEEEHKEEIEDLRKCIRNLEETIEAVKDQQFKQKEGLVGEIRKKERECYQNRQAFEAANRSNSQLRDENMKLLSAIKEKQTIFKLANDRLKSQLASANRELKDLNSTIESLKQLNKRTSDKLSTSQTKIQQLLLQLKKLQQLYETKLDNMSLENSYEYQRLEKENKQLRQSIEQLIQVKNQLVGQNKGLVRELRKREEKENQRRALIRSEIKEIDRLERVVEKLL